MSGRRLCRLDDIADGGSAGFALPAGDGGEALRVMAIRRGGALVCYVNVCPHWGAPLDITPGRFLDRERQHILCSTHGALFRIDDGRCIRGPCLGAALAALRCRVDSEGDVIVD
jgi:nitrite reductase/ring-hydroxylating ferredoxin subunit